MSLLRAGSCCAECCGSRCLCEDDTCLYGISRYINDVKIFKIGFIHLFFEVVLKCYRFSAMSDKFIALVKFSEYVPYQ